MSEYIVTRDTSVSGSSGENIQSRSIADGIFLYAARKNYPLVYGLGGYLPDAKTGKWTKVKGALRSDEKHVQKHEWYSEDLITFDVAGGAAVADTTTGTYNLSSAAEYAKVRVGEQMRCKQTGELVLITAKGSSPEITIKRNLYQKGAATALKIPASAEWRIVGRAVKEYSGAGSERDSKADNNYNLMQIVREDASLSRSEQELELEQNGADWDPLGRRKAKALHVFMQYCENVLTYGGRGTSLDADSKNVNLCGGINDFIAYNVLGASAADSSSEFSGYGHGGSLSFDEFMEYTRILSKQYDKGEVVPLLGGSIWDKCFTTWARNFPGAQFSFSTETDTFGYAISKVKTPWLTIQLLASGVVEENEPDSGLFIDPKLMRVLYHQKPAYTEIDMMKTQRIDGTAFTWLTEMTLEVKGAKRFGKIKGVNSVEV